MVRRGGGDGPSTAIASATTAARSKWPQRPGKIKAPQGRHREEYNVSQIHPPQIHGRHGRRRGAAAFKFPSPAIAQAAPFKLGLLTVKTGPLAQGGIQMEQGIVTFLKEKNYTFAGRKVEFISADTGGNPAGAKTKAQELVERDKVDAILGPLAAFELLAITDYIAQHKTPLLSLAAAEDMTQRRPNPYFLRASATSSQAMHPMADYAAKELKLKRIITISEDFAFGYEQMGGFQQTFEDDGGKIVKKLWPPIVTPDYTPYLAQISDCDGVCQGFAGSNPLRFMKQYAAAGLKFPVVTGETGGDDALLRSFGDEAVGMYQLLPVHARPRHRQQQALRRRRCRRTTTSIPASTAPASTSTAWWSTRAEKTGGKSDDKDEFRWRRSSRCRSPTRRAGRSNSTISATSSATSTSAASRRPDGKLINKTVKTYNNVSQFWTYDEKKFLAQPVYSRDYPPLKS